MHQHPFQFLFDDLIFSILSFRCVDVFSIQCLFSNDVCLIGPSFNSFRSASSPTMSKTVSSILRTKLVVCGWYLTLYCLLVKHHAYTTRFDEPASPPLSRDTKTTAQISPKDLAAHGKDSKELWVAIEGAVYDVTEFA